MLKLYEKLQDHQADHADRVVWLTNARTVAEHIYQRRFTRPIDIQALLNKNHKEIV